VILLAQFCTCGSIVINNHCTNKNCSTKSDSASGSGKVAKARKSTKEAKTDKPPKANPRRASKCITYNLYDIKEENQS
jgi:hypothetical protein